MTLSRPGAELLGAGLGANIPSLTTRSKDSWCTNGCLGFGDRRTGVIVCNLISSIAAVTGVMFCSLISSIAGDCSTGKPIVSRACGAVKVGGSNSPGLNGPWPESTCASLGSFNVRGDVLVSWEYVRVCVRDCVRERVRECAAEYECACEFRDEDRGECCGECCGVSNPRFELYRNPSVSLVSCPGLGPSG